MRTRGCGPATTKHAVAGRPRFRSAPQIRSRQIRLQQERIGVPILCSFHESKSTEVSQAEPAAVQQVQQLQTETAQPPRRAAGFATFAGAGAALVIGVWWIIRRARQRDAGRQQRPTVRPSLPARHAATSEDELDNTARSVLYRFDVNSADEERPVLVGRLRTGPGQLAWEPCSHSGSVSFRGTPSLWLPPLDTGIAASSSAFELLNLHLQYVSFLKHSDTLELLQQAQAQERYGSAYIPVLPTQAS
ncbi:hypothetical protein WJX74_001164 [Apatococcus lobatus]|uniref:Uncharacterized protein n=1 Tax=Apatococcus lobatus TaxID=904363 RepID=A0AAW1S1H8_9CHLO